MPRQKTMKAFWAWQADPANVDALIAMVANGTKLQSACMQIKQPWNLVHPFLHSTPELLKRYEDARRARADKLWDEKIEIADATKGAERVSEVMAAKLRIEARHEEAVAWNRERYGQQIKVERGPQVPSDQALLGFASELLKLVKGSEPRVIEQAEALPAPKEDGQI